MIGQEQLRTNIASIIEGKTYPRFSILCGAKGSGKKLLANDIAKQLKAHPYQLPDVKVETIRQMISDAYKIAEPTVYLIFDADSMSVAAKNALLKVTEEPPHNAYFIMTLEDKNSTLPTIKSRGTVFDMEYYTPDQIEEYTRKEYCPKNIITDEILGIIRQLCRTPGDVDTLVKMDVLEFYEYCNLVFNNIALVSGSNAFKIASKIAIKEDEEGYDLKLFWRAFMSICNKHVVDISVYGREDENTLTSYTAAVHITSNSLQSLNIKGINRQAVFDMWLLDIRMEWM